MRREYDGHTVACKATLTGFDSRTALKVIRHLNILNQIFQCGRLARQSAVNRPTKVLDVGSIPTIGAQVNWVA